MVEYRCRHLLIKNDQSRNPVSRRTGESTQGVSEDAARAELTKIKENLTAENFADESFKRSDCGSFQNGGDLGVFGENAMMKPFEDAVAALQIGEISDIVKTDSGLHLILRTPLQ